MRLLLDTHILLWWVANDPRLASDHRQLIADPSNHVFVSSVSIAEISIMVSIGKLEAPTEVAEVVLGSGFELLAFDAAHAEELRTMSWHHRDPFDRMLVAQARVEDLVLVSIDERIRLYDVECL